MLCVIFGWVQILWRQENAGGGLETLWPVRSTMPVQTADALQENVDTLIADTITRVSRAMCSPMLNP